jgi:PPM family protein phosphatase
METFESPLPGDRVLQWSGRTECGPVRKNNEDAFIALQVDSQEVHHLGATGGGSLGKHNYVFAVSDGMGGANAGEHASRIAIEEITRLFPKFHRHSEERLMGEYAAVLEELFVKVHKSLALLGRSYEECRGMETTLSLCWFTKTQMFFGHVGDCRIYRFSQGGLLQLTEDDTHVGWLFRTGQINEREARSHPRRKSLQRALGAGNQFVTPQVGALSYQSGDRLLICSDGLIEGLFDEQISDFFRGNSSGTAARDLGRLLVKDSISNCGQDNTTAVIIEVL